MDALKRHQLAELGGLVPDATRLSGAALVKAVPRRPTSPGRPDHGALAFGFVDRGASWN